MELPNDVIMEILCRLPFHKVGKIRALSRSHNEASYHSYHKYLLADRQREPILDGFLLQSLGSSRKHVLSFATPRPNSPPLNLSLSFLPGHNPQVLAVAPNGLLLCQTQHPVRYHKQFYTICKLPTKQWKGIPIPKTRFFTSNNAMYVSRSSPLRFKILRLSRDKISSKRPLQFCYTICEVFDSESWRWKQLEDLVHDNNLSLVEPFCAAVLVRGSAHWKFFDETSIFAFDFLTETWSRIAMPETIIVEHEARNKTDPFKRWDTRLVEYKGKLGLIREFNEPAAESNELWVMENYRERAWTKKCEFLEPKAMALYGSDILMATENSEEVKFCSIETGSYSYRQLEQRHYSVELKVFPFLSDFEAWNFDPPPRTLNPRTMAKLLRRSPPCISK